MNRRGADAILDEFFGEFVCTVFGAGKHQHLLPVVSTNQVAQQIALVCLWHQMHGLIHQFGRGIAACDFNAHGLIQQAVRQRFDFIGERRREQQGLTLLGHHREYLFDITYKAHVKHAISFVEHQNFNAG